jgi:hypothetical protein
MDGENGVAVVVGATERERELQRLQLSLGAGHVHRDLYSNGVVLLVRGESEQLGGVIDAAF